MSATASGPATGPAQGVESLDRWAEGESEAHGNRRYGRLAAVLFITGGLASIPNNLLHEPPHEPTIFLLSALAVASGLVCLAIPWERISHRWFHLLAVVASLEVLVSVWLGDAEFAWYYVFVAIYAAYVFRTRIEVAAQVGFACLMLMVPAVIGYEPDDHQLVELLVGVPALMIAGGIVVILREELERSREGYRFLSRRDALTGVGNYRELRDSLEREIARHRLARHRFALILIDLDDFKAVNDVLGHLGGDRVLRDVGQLLLESVRPRDTVCRHGGDEFSVVAPDTSEEEAAGLALRLEQAVPRIVVGDVRLTATTGLAVFPEGGETADGLLATADHSLFRDKRGRTTLREGAETT